MEQKLNRDIAELNAILEKCSSSNSTAYRPSHVTMVSDLGDNKENKLTGLTQWSSSDQKTFIPTSSTTKNLIPGVYEIRQSSSIGIYFEKIPVVTNGLIKFPESNSDRVISEIKNFWSKEDMFREYKLAYRRGIIFWGPPGSGKSTTIRFIMQDVIDIGGVVINFTHPELFTEGVRKLREIQSGTPIVCLMEDIDSILEQYSESSVLNILDGVNQIDKIVFIATTNYPEKLGDRIINRPSRFDKRFKIGHPNAESRRLYLEFIIGDKFNELGIDLDRWVRDTEGFSVAHIKELFSSVAILNDPYEEAIYVLSTMKKDKPDSYDDQYRSQFGFSK